MYKVVVYVPLTHADELRQLIGDTGGGSIGNYSHCSFSSRGTGRFLPREGATPAIGEVGKPEEVDEERIEFLCDDAHIKGVLNAIRKTHPYESPAIDVWQLADI